MDRELNMGSVFVGFFEFLFMEIWFYFGNVLGNLNFFGCYLFNIFMINLYLMFMDLLFMMGGLFSVVRLMGGDLNDNL